MKITAGTTGYILDIFIQDSSATDGAGLAGLVYNTASLTAKYKRQGSATWTTISLATATAGTWASGGFVAAGSADAGDYELHLPNAAIASGVAWVAVSLQGAANMAPTKIRLGLTATNDQDAVRAGMTALPNAEADAAGGLPISDAGALDLDAILADTDELQSNQGNWVTATGFSTHSASDVYMEFSDGSNLTALTTATGFSTHSAADVYTEFGDGANLTTLTTATGFATQASVDVIDGIVDTILVDTNDLQTNQGSWITATGFSTQASVDVIDGIVDAILVDTDDLQLNQGDWVDSGLGNNFDPAVDVVAQVTLVDTTTANTDMRGTNSAALAATALSNVQWTNTLATNIGTTNTTVATNLDAAVSSRSTHSAANVLTALGTGSWATSLGSASAIATAQADLDIITGADGVNLLTATQTTIDTILVDTNELQTNQGNWVTATGFSTHSAADVYTEFSDGANLTALTTATGFATFRQSGIQHSQTTVFTVATVIQMRSAMEQSIRSPMQWTQLVPAQFCDTNELQTIKVTGQPRLQYAFGG
jgi:hypothetical protein